MAGLQGLGLLFSNNGDGDTGGGVGHKGGRKTERTVTGACSLEPDAPASTVLVWMKTSAGRCSWGTAWAGQVGTAHIGSDGESITNLSSSVSRLFE